MWQEVKRFERHNEICGQVAEKRLPRGSLKQLFEPGFLTSKPIGMITVPD